MCPILPSMLVIKNIIDIRHRWEITHCTTIVHYLLRFIINVFKKSRVVTKLVGSRLVSRTSILRFKRMHMIVYIDRLDLPWDLIVKHFCFSNIELKSLDFTFHFLEAFFPQCVIFFHLLKTNIILHRFSVMMLCLLSINLNYKCIDQNKCDKASISSLLPTAKGTLSS